jgi:hypothetical protein
VRGGKIPRQTSECVCILTRQFRILLALGELASDYPHPYLLVVHLGTKKKSHLTLETDPVLRNAGQHETLEVVASRTQLTESTYVVLVTHPAIIVMLKTNTFF